MGEIKVVEGSIACYYYALQPKKKENYGLMGIKKLPNVAYPSSNQAPS